jgi:hypothetical protein
MLIYWDSEIVHVQDSGLGEVIQNENWTVTEIGGLQCHHLLQGYHVKKLEGSETTFNDMMEIRNLRKLRNTCMKY